MNKRERRRQKDKARGKTSKKADPTRLRLRLAVLAAAVAGCAALAIWRQAELGTGLPAQLTRGSAAGFHVLLITLDTTRPDHLGCYGYDGVETPALDGLAESGILFADAVTPAPITAPAHASILTGLDPPHHGLRNNGTYRLSEDKTTLAELLRGEGYETAAFTSAFVLDARFGLDQGFDSYNDDIGATKTFPFAFHEDANQRPAVDVTDAAVEWLQSRDSSRPFFSWVHYYDPHKPYESPQPFADQYPDRPYDAEIAYMDSQIGRLLEVVRATGHGKNLLTIVVSDHGEGFGEHREETHARLIYESVMHASLTITCPTLFDGPYVVDDAVVSIVDVFPTILELLDVQDAPAGDGISLLHAGADPDRMVFMESVAPYLDHGWSPLFGLRRHGDKYILAPRPEYYDLHADPHELSDLYRSASRHEAAARDVLVAELAKRMETWPELAELAATATQPDPETVRRLQALGYVGETATRVASDQLPDPKDMMVVMEKIEQANGLIDAGQFEQALRVAQSAAVISTRDLRVHHLMGKIYLGLGREAKAEEAFLAANSVRPSADACLLLGQIRIKDKRYTEAVEALDQASALDPKHGGVLIARGDLLAIHNRPQEAIAAYERAAEIDPYRIGQASRERIAQTRKTLGQTSAP